MKTLEKITIDQVGQIDGSEKFRCKDYKFGFVYQRILTHVLESHPDIDVEDGNFRSTLEDMHEFSMRVLSRSFMMYMNHLYTSGNEQEGFRTYYKRYQERFCTTPQPFCEFFHIFNEAFDILSTYYERSLKNYQYVLQLLNRYKTDVQQNFQLDPYRYEISELNLAQGDKHEGGLGTVSFLVNNIPFYIKWKDASLEINHHRLYEHFQEELGLSTSEFDLAILPLGDCYVQKGIVPEEVDSKDEFFANCGIFLFVTYLISGSDFHYENVISTGNTVITIDSENLFNLRQNFSVFETSLVSSFSIREKTLAAFSNNYDGDLDVKTYEFIITDHGIEKRLVVTEKESLTLNVPKQKGKHLSFYKHKDRIIRGFEMAYNYFLEDKDSVIQMVRYFFNGKKARVIDKHTYTYSDAIWSSYTPKLLTSREKRKRFFEKLQVFNDLEISFLLKGFIPYKDQMIQIPDDYFVRFNTFDLDQQKVFIEESFSLEQRRDQEYSGEIPNASVPFVTMEEVLEACYQDLITKKLVLNGEVNWLEVIEKGNTEYKDFQIDPMPETIYYGRTGIYLFLVKYFQYRPEKKKKFKGFDQNLQAFIASYKKQIQQHPSVQNGLFDGAAGLLVLMNESKQYPAAEIVDLAEFLSGNVDYDQSFDVISGSAGLLKVLLHMYKTKEYKELRHEIQNCALAAKSHLLHHIYRNKEKVGWVSRGTEKDINFGYSHGLAGYLPVLYQYSQIFNDDETKGVVDDGLMYLLANHNPEQHTWPTSSENQAALTNWCHGTPGILLSIGELYQAGYQNDDLHEVLQSDLRLLLETEKDSLSLCHGRFGNSFIGLFLSSVIGERDLHEKFEDQLKADFLTFFTQNNIPLMNKSFMTGYSGILYIYLTCLERGLVHFE
ncbi:DUF4135 domain-containing protein [Halobacillus fulvus]|nr:DUF4135 domain-containing protein [Halobacillus fulvus]